MVRKVVVNTARLLLAVAFILSGFVKAVDPLGTQYKIADYLQAMHLGAAVPDFLTLTASVVLSAVEFGLGICLLFAIRRRLVSTLVLCLMGVLLVLTLWLAVANPISDCGCFGDAVILTNGQTLAKNVVLLVCAVLVRRWPQDMARFISKSNQWIVTNYSMLFIFAVSAWSLYDLPQFDFRPYHVGANILEGMEIPEDAEQPTFETTYLMEKDGVRQTFDIDHYPDSTWTLIEAHTQQLTEGYVPPIHDFCISDRATGDDITRPLLEQEGYLFLLVTPHLEAADDSQFDRINELYEYASDHGYRFYGLTASDGKAIARWRDMTGAEYTFYQADETVLKTVIRSNPGLLLLKDGTILRKWSHNNLPQLDEQQANKPLEQLEIGHLSEDSIPRKILDIILWYVLPLFLLTVADRLWAWSRWTRQKSKTNKIYKLLSKTKMRKKIVAGNWKMNLNLQDGVALAKELNEALAADKPHCGVVICTPFIHLASVAQVLDQNVIGLGAENCADKEKGAYTGEVSAEMVKSTGAQYVILGHSERRQYYGETPEILKEKVLLALKNGLKVIFCIGETLEEREANKQNEVVKAELEGSVFNLSEEDFRNIIIAYEPIWAIGTGKTATAEQAEEIHAYIRSIVAEKYGETVADDTTILYGGSCKASNAPELFAKPDIDGGLIGGASLKCADFKGIIDAWKK